MSGILQLGPARAHIVLLSVSVVQVGRVIIFLSEKFRFTGYAHFIQIPVNDVVTPHFSRCMLIVSRFQPLTEEFLHNRHS